MEKICTVVVTYNRKQLLLENIKATLKQKRKIDKLIIIDNHGSDNTQAYLEENLDDNSVIDYIYLENNIGGAGGFEYGVKKAFEDGYDWVILMDDDGKPMNDETFSNLFEYIEENKIKSNNLVMINSLVMSNEQELSFGINKCYSIEEIEKKYNGRKIVENLINPFNGTLISRGLIEKIGYPNGQFFIKGDEVDYTRRAIKANAIVGTILKSIYNHPKVSNCKHLKFMGIDMIVFIEAPWKEYYSTRNNVYSLCNSMKSKKKVYEFVMKRIYCVLVCKCEKIKTLKMIMKGYKDGKNGNLGATIKP